MRQKCVTFLKGFSSLWPQVSLCAARGAGRPSLAPEFSSPEQEALKPRQLLAEFSFWPRTGRCRKIFVRRKKGLSLAGGWCDVFLSRPAWGPRTGWLCPGSDALVLSPSSNPSPRSTAASSSSPPSLLVQGTPLPLQAFESHLEAEFPKNKPSPPVSLHPWPLTPVPPLECAVFRAGPGLQDRRSSPDACGLLEPWMLGPASEYNGGSGGQVCFQATQVDRDLS